MLNRQKSLLFMLERAGRPVSHLELTKWAFLLAQEMPSRGGASFYQFLPYLYGPFSFCLYQEVGALVRDGYLVDENNLWRVVADVPRPTATMPGDVRADAARVVDRFKDATKDTLIEYVYGRFPWFTVNSALKQLRERPVAEIQVYTVGYEGWLADGFLDVLLRAGIQRLIDVRSNPVARRYGFHKSTLARLCGNVEIEYRHVPQLGIPSEQRQGLNTTSDYEALFARYETETLPRERRAVAEVAALMTERPSALMCMEANPAQCHRSILAKALASNLDLPVQHLGMRNATRI